MSAPCSALCTALVTAKNSSLPVHHLPVGVDPDAAEQRHVGGEQLGDAAAVRRGVEVEDPRALQRLGQLADPVDDVDADHARVVVEVLLEQGDAIEHGHSGGARGRESRSIYRVMLSALVCPDKFKGTLDAAEAAAAMAAGLRRAGFDDVGRVAARRRR